MTIQDRPTRPKTQKRPVVLLLLEPEPQRRGRLADWLEQSGFQCVAAEVARPGTAKSLAEPQAVLASAELDCLSGGGTVEDLRQAWGVASLPLLIYGERLDGWQRAKLLADGANDAMTLGEPADELTERIRSLLAVKALRVELARCKLQFRRSLTRQEREMRRLRRRNRHLRGMAFTDGLTGLYNVRYFQRWFATQFEIARRYKLTMSALVIDIDNFKRINDTCGHPFGDYVLTRFAEVIRQQVRASDVAARIGGDEFVVGSPETGRLDAVRFGRRLLRAVASTSFQYFGRAESITVSIGQAGFPEDEQVTTAGQLILFADQALYWAKSRGRNDLACWHELDPAVRQRLADRQLQAQELRMSAGPTLCLLDPE